MIRIFGFCIPWPIAFLGIADLFVLLFSAYLGYLGISIRNTLSISSLPLSIQEGSLYQSFTPSQFQIGQIVAFAVVCLISLFMLGAYRRRTLLRLRDAVPSILLGHFLGFVMLTILFYIFQDMRIFLLALLPAILLSLLLVTMNHYLFKQHVAHQRLRRRIVVLGTGPAANKIAQMMAAGRTPMVDCLGFISLEGMSPLIEQHHIIHSNISLPDFVEKKAIDEIVVAVEERRKTLPVGDLLRCRVNGTLVTNLSTFFEREEGRVALEMVHPSWIIFSPGFSLGGRAQRSIKRLFDVVLSLLGLLFGLPVLVIVAAAILAGDSVPILYKQTRVGLKGRHFGVIKFRTMRADSEADGVPQWSQANDPRVTRLGKFLRRSRIDEMPQFYNILRGEMSFIGPRPERPEFVKKLEEEISYYDYRHTVKPGLTGWAQINYPYGSSVEDAKRKLEYDLYYIKNYSVFLDIIILLQTFRVILRPERNWYEVNLQVASNGKDAVADPVKPSSFAA